MKATPMNSIAFSVFLLLVTVGCVVVCFPFLPPASSHLHQGSSLCQCNQAVGTQTCISETTVDSCDKCSSSACGPNIPCFHYKMIAGTSSGYSCTDISEYVIENEEYKVVEDSFSKSFCDQTTCCCLVGTVKVSNNGPLLSISGALKGVNCPSNTVDSSFNASMYGESFHYFNNFLGNDYTLIQGTKNMLFIDPVSNACSVTLEHPKSGNGMIVAIVIGVVIALVVIAGVVVFFVQRRRASYSKI